jgi:phosphohistidine phosphatase
LPDFFLCEEGLRGGIGGCKVSLMEPRRLVLLRHAKSSWDDPTLDDHARPLAARGRRDAPRVASALVQRGLAPGFVLVSDARRAVDTWSLAAPVAGAGVGVWESRLLYHGGLPELMEAARVVPPSVGVLWCIGHNPDWEELVHALCGVSVELPTAAAAVLDGAGPDWASALRGRWSWRERLRPRDLPAGEE